MEDIEKINSEIKSAEDFLKEGPNGSERMAVIARITELKNKKKKIRSQL